MRLRSVALVLVLTTLGGCAGRLAAATRSESVGHTGCPASQIATFDIERGWNGTTWMAVCGEDLFSCSGSELGSSCTPVPPERITPDLRQRATAATAAR